MAKKSGGTTKTSHSGKGNPHGVKIPLYLLIEMGRDRASGLPDYRQKFRLAVNVLKGHVAYMAKRRTQSVIPTGEKD